MRLTSIVTDAAWMDEGFGGQGCSTLIFGLGESHMQHVREK